MFSNTNCYDQRIANLHTEALAQFNDIQSAMRDERLQCLQDRRFYSLSGSQWEGPLWDQFENKPKFEVNKIMLSVIRIINEYRNNRITVDFVSKDGEARDDLADTLDGLYRADEQDSVADEAYDNAFEEAVGIAQDSSICSIRKKKGEYRKEQNKKIWFLKKG